MTRTLRILGSLLTLLSIIGCATVTICDQGDHTMVNIENSNWLLLSFIPLGSGEPEFPNEFNCRLFSNSATIESNMYMLSNIMDKEGAKHVRGIASHTTDEKVFFFLLKRHAFHTSAELVRKPTATESEPITSASEKNL